MPASSMAHTRRRRPPLCRALVARTLGVVLLVGSLSLCLTGCSSSAAPASTDSSGAADTTEVVAEASATSAETMAETDAATATTSAHTECICIDAGHGDTVDLTQTPKGPGSTAMQPVEPGGASGVNTGTPEYEVNLDVALKLQADLEARGYTVVMVRTTNDVVMSSEDRAKIANDAGADLFIRLHCDGSGFSTPSGFSTLVPGENGWTAPIVAQSRVAADVMHPLIVSELGCADAGIVERTDLAGFNFSEVPTVLFEMGFLSNPDEEQLLISDAYQARLATAIADGCDAYFTSIG